MCRMKPSILTIAIPSITVVAGIVKKRNMTMVNTSIMTITSMNIAGAVDMAAVASRAMFAR